MVNCKQKVSGLVGMFDPDEEEGARQHCSCKKTHIEIVVERFCKI